VRRTLHFTGLQTVSLQFFSTESATPVEVLVMRFIVTVLNTLDEIDIDGFTEDVLEEARELEEHFTIQTDHRLIAGDHLTFYGSDGNTLYAFEVVQVQLSGDLVRYGEHLELRLNGDHELRVKWVSIR
jgi:hypothetical protein